MRQKLLKMYQNLIDIHSVKSSETGIVRRSVMYMIFSK